MLCISQSACDGAWKEVPCLQNDKSRPSLSDPREGGDLFGPQPGLPPTHPPTRRTPPGWGGGGLYPPPTVTYNHLIEKPPLAVVWRKDATADFPQEPCE